MTPPMPDLRECVPGDHDWETSGGWGVIIGLSRCKRCDKVSSQSDFPAARVGADHERN